MNDNEETLITAQFLLYIYNHFTTGKRLNIITESFFMNVCCLWAYLRVKLCDPVTVGHIKDGKTHLIGEQLCGPMYDILKNEMIRIIKKERRALMVYNAEDELFMVFYHMKGRYKCIGCQSINSSVFTNLIFNHMKQWLGTYNTCIWTCPNKQIKVTSASV